MTSFIGLTDVKLPWAATVLTGLLLFTLSYACGEETPPPPPAPTLVIIEKVVKVEAPVEVEKIIEVVKEVPVEVVVEKVVVKEVPVEVVKEVVREMPVEVVVEKIVEVSVPLPTPTPRPEIAIRKSRNISAGRGYVDGGFSSDVYSAYSCALRENGEVACWGAFGQSSPPGGSFAEIAAGYDQSCGLRHNGEVVCWGNNIAGQSSPGRGSFATWGRSARVLTGEGPSDPATPPSAGEFGSVAMPATMLARFSTSDAIEGEARASAAGEIIAQYTSGRADIERVLDLLHTVAPELSIDERRRAADELATLSERRPVGRVGNRERSLLPSFDHNRRRAEPRGAHRGRPRVGGAVRGR